MPVLSKGVCFGTLAVAAFAAEPNPPEWPSTVKIYSPSDDIATIQAGLDDSWAKNGGQHKIGNHPEPRARYSPFRFAFLFKPGTYNVSAPMGYYVHIAGIGATPDEVVFKGKTGPHVPCENKLPQPGQLVTFWRAAERFKRIGDMDWFVSQAAPIRDIHVDGNLNLYKDTSNGSGGYLANSKVTGDVKGGGQQQWFARNVEVGGKWEGIAWNTVFVGCKTGTSQTWMLNSRCGQKHMASQTQVVPKTPLIAEKPFISVDPADGNKFNLNVPPEDVDAVGTRWHTTKNRVIPFESVYVTGVNDTVQIMNAKLKSGLDLVVSPGIYLFDEPLVIDRSDTVVLCLGLTSFVSTSGNALIEVKANLGGVRVGGCLLEASYKETEALFQWGNESETKTTPKPSFLYDLITRVGGPAFNGRNGGEAQAKIHLKVDSDDVVADHLWLWRGDHFNNNTENKWGEEDDNIVVTQLGQLPNAHGLVVTADRVKVYNLAVEHSTEDQVIWSGEDGEVYFFQCEIPYEMDQAWADKNYVAYNVTQNVKRHKAYGVGAYTYFPFNDIMMGTGFSVPPHLEDSMHGPFVTKLWGFGGINSTMNGKGPGAGSLLAPGQPLTDENQGKDAGVAYYNNQCNGNQPNPPIWPSSAKIFGPSTTPAEIQAALDESWKNNGGQYKCPNGTHCEPKARYSPFRYWFAFKPGTYSVDAPLGYYVHVAGLGRTPGEVVFEGKTGPHVPCENSLPQPGQLVTFWRTVERFKRQGSMDWFVSQAAPIRDIHITGNLNLHKEGSHGSGGYLANALVDGDVNGGGQQQWFTRNLKLGKKWNRISWNAVFVGCETLSNEEHMTKSMCGTTHGKGQTVVVDQTPTIAEKPFISVDSRYFNKFNLNVPRIEHNARGNRFNTANDVYPFEEVYVTNVTDLVTTMNVSEINAKLEMGLHLVISPGIYLMDAPLKVTYSNQVVLCLGLASLVSTNGNALIEVESGIGGVRVAGCLLEAGLKETAALMKVGEEGKKDVPGNEHTVLHDIITRVGGPAFNGSRGSEAQADTQVRIDSNNVIADHLWLWRGDHYNNLTENGYGEQDDDIKVTKLGELPNPHGLVVTSDKVKVYNLAVEHATEDQVVWSGEEGEVYFFQCEVPYDVDPAWAEKKYVAYRVTENVTKHKAFGVGAYTYFAHFDTIMDEGFRVPEALEDSIHGPFTVKLSGMGAIKAIINGKGDSNGFNGENHTQKFYNNKCSQWPEEGKEPEPEPTTTQAPSSMDPLPILAGSVGLAAVCGLLYYLSMQANGGGEQGTEMGAPLDEVAFEEQEA